MTDLYDGQYRATRDDGRVLLLGEGTPYTLTNFKPFARQDIRRSDQDSPGGQVGGRSVYTGRPIIVDVLLDAWDFDKGEAQRDFEAAQAFFRPSEMTIAFEWCQNGEQRLYHVSPNGIEDQAEDGAEYCSETVRLELKALDGTSYGAEQTFTVDADTTCTYGGNYETTAYVWRVDGPCTSPRFKATNSAGDLSAIEFLDPDRGGVVPSGWSLIVDAYRELSYLVDTDGGPHFGLKATSGGRYADFAPLYKGLCDAQFTSDSGADTATLTVHPAI